MKAHQRVSIPSKIGKSSTVFKDFRLTPDYIVYMPPVGLFDKEMLGLDIPLIVPLPCDVPPSIFSPTWDASCVNQLVVKVAGGASASTEMLFASTFDIPVQSFESLPLYRQFSEPVRETHISLDNYSVVHSTVTLTCVGPQDKLSIVLQVLANPMHNKHIKALGLKEITVKLNEVLECFDGGLPTHKVSQLASFHKNYNTDLTTKGLTEKITLVLPYRNDWLDLYDGSRGLSEAVVTSGTATFARFKAHSTPATGVPLTNTQSFSMEGKLFTLRHQVSVEVNISHGKNIEFLVPITVSPFNVSSCEYLFLLIREECQVARELFGNEMVNELAYEKNQDTAQNILQSFCPPPSVIGYTRAGLQELGCNPDKVGTGSTALMYID